MKITILHGCRFNTDNSALYTINYLDETQQPLITISTTIFKGLRNTWESSTKFTPAGYEVFNSLISHVSLRSQKNDLSASLERYKDRITGKFLSHILSIDKFLAALLNIPVNDNHVYASKFLEAWQIDSNTLSLLKVIVDSGWLPKSILENEEKRQSNIIIVKINTIIGQIRQYTDKIECIFVLSSNGEQLIKIHTIRDINDNDMQITTSLSPDIMDKIATSVSGSFKDWAQLNINKPIILNEQAVMAGDVPYGQEYMWLLNRIMRVCNIYIDKKYAEGICYVLGGVMRFSNEYRNAKDWQEKIKRVMAKEIQAISVKTSLNQIEKDKAISDITTTHNAKIDKWGLVATQAIFGSGKRAVLSIIKFTEERFFKPISYMEYNIPYEKTAPIVPPLPIVETMVDKKAPEITIIEIAPTAPTLPSKSLVRNVVMSIIAGIIVRKICASKKP